MSCCKEVKYPSNDIKITFEFQGMTMIYEGELGNKGHTEELQHILKQMVNGIGYSYIDECWLLRKDEITELKCK